MHLYLEIQVNKFTEGKEYSVEDTELLLLLAKNESRKFINKVCILYIPSTM